MLPCACNACKIARVLILRNADPVAFMHCDSHFGNDIILIIRGDHYYYYFTGIIIAEPVLLCSI